MSVYETGAAGGSHSSAYEGGTSSPSLAGVPRGTTGGGHPGGFLAILENLGHDVGGAITGFIPGAVHFAEHPLGTLESVAHSYADTYGPLFHGDIGEFLHGVKEHPLGPILDLATLVTGGAGGVAKLGTTLADRGLIGADSALARLGQRGEITLRSPGALAGHEDALTVTKETSANPVIRKRQLLTDALLKKLPYETKVIGEMARFGREAPRDAQLAALGLKQRASDYMAAYAGLSKPERLALGVLARLPLPEHLAAWKTRLEALPNDPLAKETLGILNDPKVNALYVDPNAKMMRAHAAADELGKVWADALAQRGALTPELADAARYRHSRIAAGGIVYTPGTARAAVRRIDSQLRGLDQQAAQVQSIIGRLRTSTTPELRDARANEYRTIAEQDKLHRGSRKLEQAQEREQSLREQLTAAREHLDTLSRTGVGSARDARQLGAQLNHVSRLAEQYDRATVNLYRLGQVELPDADALARRRAADAEAAAAARSDLAARLHAGRQELERVAATKEQLAAERADIRPGIVGMEPEAMRAQIEAAGRPQPIYLPDVAREAQRGIGERILGGPRVPRGAATGEKALSAAKAPVHRSDGYLFTMGHLALEPDVLSPGFFRAVKFALYRDLHDVLLQSAVRIPKGGRLPEGHVWIRRPASLAAQPLEELIAKPESVEESRLAERGLTSGSGSDALTMHGFRFAVPEQLARQVSGEFRRSNNGAAALLAKPTQVWRSLVLGLRPAFLVTNVIGNHILYALQNAGPAGLRAYANMILNTRGVAALRRMLGDTRTRGITQEFVREYFPGQVEGTLANTQLPAGSRLRQGAGKTLQVASRGIVPATQAIAEGGLRRAAVEAELRRSPEVRAALRQMPKDRRDFERAARQALDTNPRLARRASDKANAALGNYLDMPDYMRRYIRPLVPFVAWLRVISKITVKLATDTPGRADLIAKLGDIGAQDAQEFFGGKIPEFLLAAIGLGPEHNGRLPALATGSWNPFSTVIDIGKAAASGLAGSPGQAADEVLSTVNPFPRALLEYVTGHDLATGAPIHRGHLPGALGGALENVARSTPQGRLIAPPKDGLYRHTFLDELYGYLGLPIKHVDPARARALGG